MRRRVGSPAARNTSTSSSDVNAIRHIRISLCLYVKGEVAAPHCNFSCGERRLCLESGVVQPQVSVASLAVLEAKLLRTVLISAAAVGVLLAGPAFAQSAPSPDGPGASGASGSDPWEGANRGLYKANKGLDRAIVRPTAVFYHHAITHPVREGVHNVIYNLGEPVTFLNNVVQLHPTDAGRTLVRFAVNSTVGILGIFDVTGANGLPRKPSGFADTLGRYGAPQGPYLFLPVFGPSSVRDLTGRVVDVVTDPFNWLSYDGSAAVGAGRTVAGGLDRRVASDEALKEVNRTATDPYATIRSAYLQNSSARGRDADTNVKNLPDFGPAPGTPPPASRPPVSNPTPH